MKRNFLSKGLALSMAFAMLFSTPATYVQADEAVVSETTTLPYTDGTYYYGTVNMPYADFYYGELNTILPTTDVQLDVVDPVASYREAGQYDAVSSATTSKSKNFPTTYYETTDTGVNILGIANVQVAIPVELYNNLIANQDSKASCQNRLYQFFDSITFSDTAFGEYKVMSGNGTFTAYQTADTAGYAGETLVSEATATITTSSSYGNYGITVTGTSVTVDSMLGVILETTDGTRYGMEHLENLWLKTGEMSFAVENFTEIHGNKVDYLRHASLEGKTISKITYLVKGGTDIVVNTSLQVKNLLSSEESATVSVAPAIYQSSGTTTTYTNGIFESLGYDGTLTSLVLNKTTIDPSLYHYDSTAHTITLDKTLKPGSYTATFSDDIYEDVTATFIISSTLQAENISILHNVLTLTGEEASLAEYIAAITAISINGTNKTTTGIGGIVFGTDGTINFAATVTSKGKTTALFALGGAADYTLIVTAPGYPTITTTVGTSTALYPLTSLTLDKTSLNLTKGQSEKITATYAPSNTTDSTAITYRSSNSAVATVSNDGTITAVASGSATITATMGSLTASCQVTVTVPMTKITLNTTALSLIKGKTAQLQVTCTPVDTTDSKAVTYTSSNQAIATVSSTGVITGIAVGSATITAKVGAYTATCVVTVPHTYGAEQVIKAATLTSDGSMGKICTSSGDILTTAIIPKISTVTFNKTSYTYTGKLQQPTVTIKDRTGATIASSNYTVRYSAKSIATGSYTATITFKGKYSGTTSTTYTIAPAKTTAKLSAATKSSVKVSFTKVTGATGYVVEYSTSAKFTSVKSVTTTSTSVTLKNLTKNQKYYVRVKSYKTTTVSGKSTKIYSEWSGVTSLSTKTK